MADSRFADPADPVPRVVQELAGGAAVEPVWHNGDGGLTCRVRGQPDRYVKWQPDAGDRALEREADRLRWARRHAPWLPEVLATGANGSGSWLVTTGLPGESAVSARWKADAETAVRVAGSGLRRLHDALPVAACPYDWSVQIRRRSVHPARAADPRLRDPVPTVDRLVVCHGDACVPNTLIASDGTLAGHVDLGDLGVADRWADLAVGTWSTEWNYGPGWSECYLEAYGVGPDVERTRFYRDLWDLVHPD